MAAVKDWTTLTVPGPVIKTLTFNNNIGIYHNVLIFKILHHRFSQNYTVKKRL